MSSSFDFSSFFFSLPASMSLCILMVTSPLMVPLLKQPPYTLPPTYAPSFSLGRKRLRMVRLMKG